MKAGGGEAGSLHGKGLRTNLRIGVLIPCRNEEQVIARKLANLAQCEWPAGQHHLLVIDDRSEDGTTPEAQRALSSSFQAGPISGTTIKTQVLPNDGAGKPAALATGERVLRTAGVDLVLCSDADVLIERSALLRLVEAFEADADLAMACGRQWFVEELPAGGQFVAQPAAGDLSTSDREDSQWDSLRRDGLYDRITAGVRALESRFGLLFSVHGQLLAWRLLLDLQATPGQTADDLDLRIQVRQRQQPPCKVRLVKGALFAERKETEQAYRSQALRRARAYVRTVSLRKFPRFPRWQDRLQFAAYRWLPIVAPYLFPMALIAVPLVLWWAERPLLGGAVAVISLLGLLSAPGRRLMQLLRVIAKAVSEERKQPLGDRWEMARS